jgi:heptosyltransferase-2
MIQLQSICIIRLTSLGDLVLLTPMIRVLRHSWPNARIDMIISEHCADIMKYNPHIDNLYTINTKQGTLSLFKQWHTLKKDMPNYDLAIDVHCSLRSRILRQGIAKQVLQYDPARAYKRDLVKNKTRIPIESIIPVPHRYFTALRDFPSIQPDDEGLEFWLESDKQSTVYPTQKVLKGDRILLAPGAKHATKRWPAAYFAELIGIIQQSHDVPITLIGGPDDAALCDEIQSLCTISIENVAGTMSLHELGAFMDSALCIIGNDSGLMHIAAARHIPVVTIFGSTVPEFGFLPYHTSYEIASIELPCKPCTHIGNAKCPEGHFHCMKNLTPTTVFAHLQKLLNHNANIY